MKDVIFFNIAWMTKYEGYAGQPDQPVNGGKHIRKHGRGGEVCNFMSTKAGKKLGFVQVSAKGNNDQGNIAALRKLESYRNGRVRNMTVVWVATSPEGGRRVIGWYLNATVYEQYQESSKYPSSQHKKDNVNCYVSKCDAVDAVLLLPEQRHLRLPGNLVGQTPWAIPDYSKPGIRAFMKKLESMLGSDIIEPDYSERRNSPATVRSPYIRYVEKYEIEVAPAHHDLQSRFENFLEKKKASQIKSDVNYVDLRYNCDGENFLVEIKPCDRGQCRFAIRTAMGQLLDYYQSEKVENHLIIIIGCKPKRRDIKLALSNGFYIAYPYEKKFVIEEP